ncbi:hypothetical protein MNBD_GAMMA02-1215, partial [hydrothermal vent metagenome]
KYWHPYVWEYSSFLSTFLLYFGIYWLANKASLLKQNWLRNFVAHVLASVVFSVLHVLLMVWLRQIIYFSMGGAYDFGDWFTEWIYEYRKDVITYFIFLLTLYAFQYFTHPRLDLSSKSKPQKLEIKNKQGVFWINCADIITIESGGNYIYIHANGQVLPMRSTMADIEKLLDSADFIRVHRCYFVNLNHCKGIQKQSNDSSELILLNGKIIPISKKYRTDLLAALAQTISKTVKIKP